MHLSKCSLYHCYVVHNLIFGPPEGGPILFLLSTEVSGTSGTMSRYIICMYVNNMADAKSVRNLSAIFR